MPTLVMQLVVAVLKLGFGLTAWAVARRRAAFTGRRWDAWSLTAFTFVLGGLLLVPQAAAAFPAYFAGEGSRTLEVFIRLLPVGNEARTVSMVAFAAALLLLCFTRAPVSERRRWALRILPVAGALAGGVLGWFEGALVAARHYPIMAVLSTVQLVSFLVALFAALLTSTTDRLLWGALGVYAFHEALNVMWWSGLSAIDIPGEWNPSPFQLQVYGAVIWSIMIALAMQRLAQARRGIDTPGLLDPPGSLPATLA